MTAVRIDPTSRDSASITDVVLRLTDRVRLIFRPELVNNVHDPLACLRGAFVYQKKNKSQAWEDFPRESLASLKGGEGFKLEVHADELLRLMRQLAELYRFHRKEGIPTASRSIIALERRLARVLELSQPQLMQLLDAHPEDGLQSLIRLLEWATASPSLAGLLSLSREQLPSVSALVGLAALKEATTFWKNNMDEASEEFWQSAFEERAFLLAQLFQSPVVIIGGKQYVGGKQLDNHHAGVADFLGKVAATGAPVIVEIKTPRTPLLGAEYRSDVFPPSRELAGAVAQVLHYRGLLCESLPFLTRPANGLLRGVVPKCVVIAGNMNIELTTESRQASFERFRTQSTDVTVVGFDELFDRVNMLVEVLSQVSSA